MILWIFPWKMVIWTIVNGPLIVDFPMKNGDLNHSYWNNYQMVNLIWKIRRFNEFHGKSHYFNWGMASIAICLPESKCERRFKMVSQANFWAECVFFWQEGRCKPSKQRVEPIKDGWSSKEMRGFINPPTTRVELIDHIDHPWIHWWFQDVLRCFKYFCTGFRGDNLVG